MLCLFKLDHLRTSFEPAQFHLIHNLHISVINQVKTNQFRFGLFHVKAFNQLRKVIIIENNEHFKNQVICSHVMGNFCHVFRCVSEVRIC